ncbi:hypothetical protein [Rhizomonospora bruguierae]|uniref:hypothetical protein n=1 Tax=Rhizomonospora bruguierae TaxID=1581705 RepID=UPI001BD07F28|nr:hypothetical protein [Micromonospora sp. NBRC 107566]
MQDNGAQSIGRRRLLRRAGTVAAGVAGAGVVGAVAATPAQAATPSTFTSTQMGTPAVKVENTTPVVTEEGFKAAGPQFAFTPTGTSLSKQAPLGSLSMDTSGNIWVRDRMAAGPNAEVNFLHTTRSSNLFMPMTPVRLLDTRNAAGRASVINPTNIDTSGRVKAKSWIHVDVSGLVNYGLAMIGNLVAVTPATAGFLSVVPWVTGIDSTTPGTSSLNFTAGVTIANGITVALGGDNDPETPYTSDVISIYAQTACQIVFDVSGFVVDSYSRVLPTGRAGAGLAANSGSFAEQRRAFIAKNSPKP